MPIDEKFASAVHWISLGLEAAGVAAIVVGAAIAAGLFVKEFADSGARALAYKRFRVRLARGILLGLEILVAADIIDTVAIDPSLDGVIVLGLIVTIRTFLSFSLEVEIEGRWPWQKAPDSSRS